jgi:hypothetical protein
MNACPSCSQPVGPNDVVCPKCGISLHPGTATAGPASSGGKGLSVVAIVVIAIVAIVLLVGCLGVLGAGLFWFRAAAVMPAATPSATPLPPLTETSEVEYSADEPIPLQVDPNNGPPGQAPGGEPARGETPDKP